MFSPAESDALHARVQAFIRASLDTEPAETFDALALSIARYQAAHVPAIARLVKARRASLDGATDASAIPAVPTDVFRLARVAAHPPELDVAVFKTSGTSQGKAARGEHPLRTTATYELGALSWAEELLFPDRTMLAWPLRCIVLAPEAGEQPESSLGFMLDLFTRHLEGPASFHVRLADDGSATIDREGFLRAAHEAREAREPALVLATSFALVHLLDDLAGVEIALPPGSRVMQTGGFKGRSREVPAAELRAQVSKAFGVPESHVVAEYGMTELSSQLYESTLVAALLRRPKVPHGFYAAPPWVRVVPVDPETLLPVPAGEVGIARVVDLANVDSAVAIQTADRVRLVSQGGEERVELLGRAPGAPPRGCSIAIDEMLGGA